MNVMKAKVGKISNDSQRMLGQEKEETVHHIICRGSKIIQSESKKRHDKVTAVLHWCLCRMSAILLRNNGGNASQKKKIVRK